MALARIGLGANLGDAAGNVERALEALGEVGTVVARSSLYRSKAWGRRDQPGFINAAALLETPLEPRALLSALQALEKRLGRSAGLRWGPRAIDLDILAYGNVAMSEPDLRLPHARLFERAFALAPLSEIEPSYRPAFDALPPAERTGVQRIRAAPARTLARVNWEETLERARSAAEFCAGGGLVRLRIEQGDVSIEVRRGNASAGSASALQALDARSGSADTPASTNGSAHERRPASLLRAEFVGIVRLSRPSVTLGSVVGEDRELAYVESLGIRNPIRSGGAGRIADIFVTDGDAVEYGQPLFAIEL